jgi:hypothetical protein
VEKSGLSCVCQPSLKQVKPNQLRQKIENKEKSVCVTSLKGFMVVLGSVQEPSCGTIRKELEQSDEERQHAQIGNRLKLPMGSDRCAVGQGMMNLLVENSRVKLSQVYICRKVRSEWTNGSEAATKWHISRQTVNNDGLCIWQTVGILPNLAPISAVGQFGQETNCFGFYTFWEPFFHGTWTPSIRNEEW